MLVSSTLIQIDHTAVPYSKNHIFTAAPACATCFIQFTIATLVSVILASNLSILYAARCNTPTLDPFKAMTQYIHEMWEIEQGLPQNTVQTIVQSKKGYLWLGTEEGITRFNGTAFVTFDRDNTPALAGSDHVNTIYEDSKERLWIGTNEGLISYKEGIFTRHSEHESLATQSIRAIAEDESGRLWIGSLDGGLYRCETGNCSSFAHPETLDTYSIHTLLHSDHDNTLWIGTEQGLFSLETRSDHVEMEYHGLANQHILSLYQDAENNIWIGTRENLFVKKENGILSGFPQDTNFQDGVWSIWQDDSGSMWLGLSQDGLVRIRKNRLERFPAEDKLSGGRIPALYEDREGSLWIGTEGTGLHRLRDGFFASVTEKEGLTDDKVRSVYETSDNALWIGTENGLNRWYNGQLDTYSTEEGLSDNFVTSIAGSESNDLWVGTLNGGLNHLKDNEITHFTVDEGLASNAVYALYTSSKGELWVGTDKGLNQRSGDSFITYTTEDGLPSNLITTILEDHQGTLWVGTYDAGLARWENNTFSSFASADELNVNAVIALHSDDDGVLWIGTYEGGLSRLKNGKITNYTMDDGLFDDVVFQILEDDLGNLWMGCNKGVYRIAKSEFDAFDNGYIQKLTSVSYDRTHGLKSRELNGGSQPAGWKRQDGTLWFPTIHGVASVDPSELTYNGLGSPVIIEQVTIDQERVLGQESTNSSAILRPGTERIEFTFAALTFVSPQKVKYRYRLEGYENEWSDLVTYTHAPYTHLDPGTYTFHVIAQNSEGIWNDEGARFTFQLEPFYYQSIYFWVSCLFGVGLLGFWGYRWRIKQLTRQQKRLEKAVLERTSDLRKAKEQIEHQAEELRSSLREKEVLLREVHHRVKNNLQVITSLLNLQSFRVKDPDTRSLFQECHDRINSMAMIHERLYQTDDLAEIDLASYLENISVELARSYNADRRNIRLNLDVETVHLGIDQAIPSGLIVNELVSNALKHAFPHHIDGQGEITIAFSRDDEEYKLSVTDNGKGLPQSFKITNTPSLGMKLVTALTHKLKGTLTVHQKGSTCFQIAFPQTLPS